jgi:hypothetical protein
MDLEAKLDGLSESIARIESKLDVSIAKQKGVPRLAALFEKKNRQKICCWMMCETLFDTLYIIFHRTLLKTVFKRNP